MFLPFFLSANRKYFYKLKIYTLRNRCVSYLKARNFSYEAMSGNAITFTYYKVFILNKELLFVSCMTMFGPCVYAEQVPQICCHVT